MTREEAIELVCYGDWLNILMPHLGDDDINRLAEAMCIIGSALRPVSREQVEKVWRGCSWCNNEGKKPENWECSLVDDRGFSVVVGDEVVWTNAEFCPVCGKPLTDEAVEMVMERLEALYEDNGCS